MYLDPREKARRALPKNDPVEIFPTGLFLSGSLLVQCLSLFGCHVFPLTIHNALANLRHGFTLLLLSVGIKQFVHAHVALGSMRALEARSQTLVPHRPRAVTITRKLVQNPWNPRGQSVCLDLRRPTVRSPKSVRLQNRRLLRAFGRRSLVIGRNTTILLIGILR